MIFKLLFDVYVTWISILNESMPFVQMFPHEKKSASYIISKQFLKKN